MAIDSRRFPHFDPIVMRIRGRYIVVGDGEAAIARARDAWQNGGDQADEWIGVHADLIEALSKDDHLAFGDAVKRFRSAAYVSGWLDPHPMITTNPPDSGAVSARDAAVRRAYGQKVV